MDKLQDLKNDYDNCDFDFEDIGWLIKELTDARNRELSYIDDNEQMDALTDQMQQTIKQYQLQETLLLERLQKITLEYKRLKEDRRTTRFWELAEENLKLAQELALLKGEISG